MIYMKISLHLRYLVQFLYFRQKCCRENQNPRFIFNNLLPKTVPFLCNVKKYVTARGATDNYTYNTTHTLCMLDNC